jgi:hypothetical protein
MEVLCFSETLVSIFKPSRRYNPEDQIRHCTNFKPQNKGA